MGITCLSVTESLLHRTIGSRGLSYFIRIFVLAELCYSTLLYLPWQEHSVKLILVIALLYLLVAIGMCMLRNQIYYYYGVGVLIGYFLLKCY